MRIIDFYNKIKELYPDSLRCDWDNDGLMCSGDATREIGKVLVTLDATLPSLRYAKERGYDLVLTHHPLIFKPISSLVGDEAVSKRVIYCIENGISVISLHTRLDAGKGGVNDVLAELLELTDVSVFGDEEAPELGRIGYTDVSDADRFADFVKEKLGGNITKYVCRPVNKVAVVGGAAIEYGDVARRLGCDTFVTGEGGYNRALDAFEGGINIILAGHYFSEAPVLARLEELVRDIIGCECEIFREPAFCEV